MIYQVVEYHAVALDKRYWAGQIHQSYVVARRTSFASHHQSSISLIAFQ
jgi:hypothetical protein